MVPKKAARLCTVFNAEFHASRQLLSDVVTGVDRRGHSGGNVVAGNADSDSQNILAREKMLSALNRFKDSEMDDAENS